MKKWIAMLLALCLGMSTLGALAADYENYGIYANEDGSCAFAYPGDWLVLSQENLDEFWAEAQKLGDEDLQAFMRSAQPQMEEMGMIMLVDRTMESNISIIRQELGFETTPEMLMASAASIQEQLTASMENVQFPEEPSLTEITAGKAMLIPYVYDMLDQQLLGVQAYVGVGTGLYTFTVTTNPGNEDALSVLGFVLGSASLM